MNSLSRRLIIASNRLPITVALKDGILTYTPSSGGLISGLLPVMRPNTLWVGWPGIDSETLSPEQIEEITSFLESQGMVPVFLSKTQVKNYYNGFCNSILWPLLHTQAPYEQNTELINRYLYYYKEANELFADTIARISKPTDTIWVHDYHLLHVPALLRAQDFESGFFLHTPFPEIKAGSILNEMAIKLMAAKLVGFQTEVDAVHFRTLTGDKITPGTIAAFPIGIDYSEAQNIASSLRKTSRNITPSALKPKIILCVDRLDPCKKILDRVKAYESLLKRGSIPIGSVVMRVLAVPTREGVSKYKEERVSLEKYISRVNEQYGTSSWQPVLYSYESLTRKDLYGLYRSADIALICPPADGMNLVAKEYVAVNAGLPKALILSLGVGASHQLSKAFIITNYSVENIASTIERVLNSTTEERLERMKAMNYQVKKFTSQYWGEEFLARLEGVVK